MQTTTCPSGLSSNISNCHLRVLCGNGSVVCGRIYGTPCMISKGSSNEMGSKGDREFLEAIRQLAGKPEMPSDHHTRVMERINHMPLVPDVLLSGKWKGYAERNIEEGEVVLLPNN